MGNQDYGMASSPPTNSLSDQLGGDPDRVDVIMAPPTVHHQAYGRFGLRLPGGHGALRAGRTYHKGTQLGLRTFWKSRAGCTFCRWGISECPCTDLRLACFRVGRWAARDPAETATGMERGLLRSITSKRQLRPSPTVPRRRGRDRSQSGGVVSSAYTSSTISAAP